MTKDFNSAEIIKLLDILIGNTEATDNENANIRALERLEVLCEVTDWCTDGIAFAMCTWNSEDQSQRDIGSRAVRWMDDVAEWSTRNMNWLREKKRLLHVEEGDLDEP